MKILFDQFLDRKFLNFFLVSSFAAAANFGSRIPLSYCMSYGWSIVVAYLIGMAVSYFLCGRYIFESQKNQVHQKIVYFFIINFVGIIIALGTSLFLFDYGFFMIKDTFLREEMAHFFGLSAPMFSSYLGHKYFTFQ